MISDVYFHSSDPLLSPWPYQIVAGGRSDVDDTDGIVSRNYHEHTLILTRAGKGQITVTDGVFSTTPGSVVWLDTSRLYAHGAAADHHWSYLWFALSGQDLDRLYDQSGFAEHPVQDGHSDLEHDFQSMIQTLVEPPLHADAVLNARFTAIAAKLFASRREGAINPRHDPITGLLRRMRTDIASPWSVARMADIANLSPSQLFRRFHASTGTSPVSWLRHERMVLARHLLVASSHPVASIALRCGYPDPFHFSRDFKPHHGCAPRDYRHRNQTT